MNTDVTNQIAGAAKELLQVLSSFRQEQINTVPFAGSWTAGQVGEHILKSASGVLEVVNGPVQPTERDPGEKVQALKDLFLNFEIKMKGPDFVQPSADPKDREELLCAWEKTMAGISEVARTQDLSATCVAFEMPSFGYLTRLEWISFLAFHTQRHSRQLKNMFQF